MRIKYLIVSWHQNNLVINDISAVGTKEAFLISHHNFLAAKPNSDCRKAYNKSKNKKGLPLETKTQYHENRRLDLIESLHMQHCNLRGCIRPLAPALNGI